MYAFWGIGIVLWILEVYFRKSFYFSEYVFTGAGLIVLALLIIPTCIAFVQKEQKLNILALLINKAVRVIFIVLPTGAIYASIYSGLVETLYKKFVFIIEKICTKYEENKIMFKYLGVTDHDILALFLLILAFTITSIIIFVALTKLIKNMLISIHPKWRFFNSSYLITYVFAIVLMPLLLKLQAMGIQDEEEKMKIELCLDVICIVCTALITLDILISQNIRVNKKYTEHYAPLLKLREDIDNTNITPVSTDQKLS